MNTDKNECLYPSFCLLSGCGNKGSLKVMSTPRAQILASRYHSLLKCYEVSFVGGEKWQESRAGSGKVQAEYLHFRTEDILCPKVPK